jgi:hypothetical protein
MKRRLKAKVTTVREQTTIISPETISLQCWTCGREVPVVSMGQAAGILGIDPQRLQGMLAQGSIHKIQTVSGLSWVCKDSLVTVPGPQEGVLPTPD